MGKDKTPPAEPKVPDDYQPSHEAEGYKSLKDIREFQDPVPPSHATPSEPADEPDEGGEA